jgi:hypothetical protein
VQARQRLSNGRFKTYYETVYDTTLARARKRRDELLAQITVGTFFEPSDISMKDLIEEWLAQKRERACAMRPSTPTRMPPTLT